MLHQNIVKLKIAVIGSPKSGKSSFIAKLLGETISSEYAPTMEYQMTLIELPKEKITYEIQLWDCGTDFTNHHKHLRQAFFRNSSAAFVIFDVNNKKWREQIPFWISQAHDQECFLIYAIGTKMDAFLKSIESEQQQKVQRKTSQLTQQPLRKQSIQQYEYELNEFFQEYQIKHYYQSAFEKLSSQIVHIFRNIHDDQQKVSRSSIARGIRMDNSITDSFLLKVSNSSVENQDKANCRESKSMRGLREQDLSISSSSKQSQR